MKTRVVTVGVCVSLLTLVALAPAKDHKAKPGPLTGTWECMAHGGQQGDIPFTLLLDQAGETVTGSVSSPMGGTEISAASYKNKTLNIEIDTPDGSYVLTAKLKQGKLIGDWSNQSQKGTWQGNKQDPMDP